MMGAVWSSRGGAGSEQPDQQRFFWHFGLQGSFINRDIYDDARSAQSILAIDDDD
jgi:hypothetical protein